MRILIYGINYTPELTGIGKYTGEMSAWLAKKKHDVTVITGMPYYPEWKIHERYKRRWWHKENIDGVKVKRCPLYVPKHITPLKRIIHEFTFIAAVLPVWFKTLFQKKFDVVICVSPPFHLGFLPLIYSKLRKVKLITHIQDLQVDAAKNLAMLKNGRLMNMMFGAEKFILRHSSAVSTISAGMLKKIKEKRLPNTKTILFPNWVDEHSIVPLPKEKSLRREFGFNNTDKVILYSGNLGEKQGLEIIIEVAKEFIDNPAIHFLIVGNGGNREKLQQLTVEEDLANVHFYPLVQKEKMSALLATADIHLVPQKKSASDLVMPSKVTGILSAGGCAIVTASPGTSLYELIENNNLGFTVMPESVPALKACIEDALQSNLEQYKRNARHYAISYLSKEWVMRNFERELYGLLENREKPILVYDPRMKKLSTEETPVQTR